MTRLITAAIALVSMTVGAVAQSASFVRVHEKKGTFENVQQDISEAIINRGFVVDYTARISDMLTRTAKDVGATREVYKNAVALQFCSATLSRAMFEADPATIALCPTVITIFEMASKPGVIYVSYRRMPSTGSTPARKAIAAVQQTLDGIIAEAMK